MRPSGKWRRLPAERWLPAPPDPSTLVPAVLVWRAGTALVRCHRSTYGATELNTRSDVSQRFRPFAAGGRTVPTLSGSELLAGALSETLFHDVPVTGPARRIRISRLLEWLGSTIAPRRDLRLADLRDASLGALGLTREHLIESPALAYPETAEWARALFHSPAAADGLVWNARQRREKLAMILFGRGRVARSDLEVVEPPLPLAIGRGLELVLEAAERAGITIVE